MIHNYESLTPCILVAVLYDPASRFDLVLEASPVPVVPVSYILFELFIGGRFPFPFYKLFWNERRRQSEKKIRNGSFFFEDFFEKFETFVEIFEEQFPGQAVCHDKNSSNLDFDQLEYLYLNAFFSEFDFVQGVNFHI